MTKAKPPTKKSPSTRLVDGTQGTNRSQLEEIMDERVSAGELVRSYVAPDRFTRDLAMLVLNGIEMADRDDGTDPAEFRELLIGSALLSFDEKRRMLEAYAMFSKVQISALVEIWRNERRNFERLQEEYAALLEEEAAMRQQQRAGEDT